MASEPDNSTSRKSAQAPRHVISIYQIIGFVLPWNTAFKAARVLNTLLALALGAYANRLRPVLPLEPKPEHI